MAKVENERASNPLRSMAWSLSIGAVAFYCLIAFFFWSLVDIVTPFLAAALWLPVILLGLVAVLTAVALLVQQWRSLRVRSAIPLLFLLCAFVLIRFIDFTGLWLSANFKFHRADREEVISRFANGELRPNVPHNEALIALPKDLRAVSLGGGDIVVHRDGTEMKVLFFTFRGVLDNFAGFVYSADGSPPKNGDFAGEFFVTRKVDERWFYVSAR